MTQGQAPSPRRFIDSDRVAGTAVYTKDGKHIGTVKRFVIERQSGRIAYVVLSVGGPLDLGEQTYTVPWATLHHDASVDGYRTDITEAELREAPSFVQAEDSASWEEVQEEELHAHFRIPPYWRGAV